MEQKQIEHYTHPVTKITKSERAWAKELGLSNVQGFRFRIKKYGADNTVAFYTKEQLRRYVNRTMSTTTKKKKYKLAFGKKRLCDPLDPVKLTHPLQIKAMMEMITHLIDDAKKDVIKGNVHAEASAQFLCNRNGILTFYLEPIYGDNTGPGIEALKRFVETQEAV